MACIYIDYDDTATGGSGIYRVPAKLSEQENLLSGMRLTS